MANALSRVNQDTDKIVATIEIEGIDFQVGVAQTKNKERNELYVKLGQETVKIDETAIFCTKYLRSYW